ncbi:MAG: ferric reductase-like transmembrane domain-containing protein [Patescibacteria group bacterium]
MFKTNKLLIVTITLIFFSNFFLPATLLAENVIYATSAKDSDYDGLTDQGEIQIYKTNPQNPDSDSDSYLDGAEILAGTNPLDPNSPQIVSTTDLNLSKTSVPATSLWPWFVARASGIVSYLLLFLLIVSGSGIKTSSLFRLVSPTTAWLNHRYLGIALTFSTLIHLGSLLTDNFLKFTVIDILVPFISSFKPLYLSLGIIGFYLFLAIIIFSIFYMNKLPKIWRVLHYLTYPAFIILFIHGYFIGTDTTTNLMQLIYLTTGIIVALQFSYRLYFSYKQH